MMNTPKMTGIKTVLHIIAAIATFVAVALVASIAYIIPFEPVACIVNAGLQICLTYLFISFYSKKVLHMPLCYFRIRRPVIVPVWLVLAMALPLLVSCFFLFFVPGTFQVMNLSLEQKTATIFRGVFCICMAAGITEEMVFRGFIMKLIESKWGRLCAMAVPSVAFALLHLINIQQPNVVDVLTLLAAGTSVGIMFSAITYKTGSIWPAAIAHGFWNLIIIGGILNIGTSHSGADIMVYTLSPQGTLLTGGAFGIEASLPAIIGYWLLIILAIILPKKNKS